MTTRTSDSAYLLSPIYTGAETDAWTKSSLHQSLTSAAYEKCPVTTKHAINMAAVKGLASTSSVEHATGRFSEPNMPIQLPSALSGLAALHERAISPELSDDESTIYSPSIVLSTPSDSEVGSIIIERIYSPGMPHHVDHGPGHHGQSNIHCDYDDGWEHESYLDDIHEEAADTMTKDHSFGLDADSDDDYTEDPADREVAEAMTAGTRRNSAEDDSRLWCMIHKINERHLHLAGVLLELESRLNVVKKLWEATMQATSPLDSSPSKVPCSSPSQQIEIETPATETSPVELDDLNAWPEPPAHAPCSRSHSPQPKQEPVPAAAPAPQEPARGTGIRAPTSVSAIPRSPRFGPVADPEARPKSPAVLVRPRSNVAAASRLRQPRPASMLLQPTTSVSGITLPERMKRASSPSRFSSGLPTPTANRPLSMIHTPGHANPVETRHMSTISPLSRPHTPNQTTTQPSGLRRSRIAGAQGQLPRPNSMFASSPSSKSELARAASPSGIPTVAGGLRGRLAADKRCSLQPTQLPSVKRTTSASAAIPRPSVKSTGMSRIPSAGATSRYRNSVNFA
jgi:hypothetical protein